MKQVLIAILFWVAISAKGVGQETQLSSSTTPSVAVAKAFFQQEDFGAAYPILQRLVASQKSVDRTDMPMVRGELLYMYLVCGLKLDYQTAADQANSFILTEDQIAYVQMLQFHLGEFYYRKGDYVKAVDFYDAAGVDNLTNEIVVEMKFHKAYAYFSLQQIDKALPLFDAIRQVPHGAHVADAHYYFGVIAFDQKQYKNALEAFKQVEQDPTYNTIVPFYIASSLMALGQHNQALEYTLVQLKKTGLNGEAQLLRIAGQGLYAQKKYAEAIRYFQQLQQLTQLLGRSDLYALAFSMLETSQPAKAIELLKPLASIDDTLGQFAMYHLGIAYINVDSKILARNAFVQISDKYVSPEMYEFSRFSHAKLSFELGYQDQALNALQHFVENFPLSAYQKEAREILITLLASTNNFLEALTLLEGLRDPSTEVRKIYPRILYGRAIELINEDQLIKANDLLVKVENLPMNKDVRPYVYFWRAEIAYRHGRFDEAIQNFNAYLTEPLISGEVNVQHANYSLGYCYLKKNNYRAAAAQFGKVIVQKGTISLPLQQDAHMRLADAYYMQKDFRKAENLYIDAIQGGWTTADYAYLQAAMIVGISSTNDKISKLQRFAEQYPASSLNEDVAMELASVYMAEERYSEAIPLLQNLIKEGQPTWRPKAYLKLGLAYYNLDNHPEALIQYTALLDLFPNSSEADDALENVRSILIEEGKSEAFVAYARSKGKAISVDQEDQLAYEEAERFFNNANFTVAVQKFETYLDRFPEGKHVLEALYYKSDIYRNQKNCSKAVQGYEILAARVPHAFGERSIMQAARIYFFDLHQYDKAILYFQQWKQYASTQENKLEAMRGLLRSQFQLKYWLDGVPNAQELLSQRGIGTDDQLLANLMLAKAYQSEQRWAEAITAFRSVAYTSKASYGAEARFEIARCYFTQEKWVDAEKQAFEVIRTSGSYEIWVIKAYILLGDVYLKQKDYFNAKATYQSVVDHAKDESLRQDAQTKLTQAVLEEKGLKN